MRDCLIFKCTKLEKKDKECFLERLVTMNHFHLLEVEVEHLPLSATGHLRVEHYMFVNLKMKLNPLPHRYSF